MPTMEFAERASGQSAILDFFGLREQPFGVTPDPKYLYLTASHREALASLVYGIESKRGFSALVAEPGMGKTTLLFYLLDKLKSTARTAFLFRPDGNTKELLESLLLDLGLEANPEDVPQMHETLKAALLEDLESGKHFVWVIDEAQDLEPSVLESVRLLSNFETPASKLMHILLVGQPGLFEKLAAPELLQLRQRIGSLVQIAPLSDTEVSDYIRFRVVRGGGNADTTFTPEARMLIAQASEGIPRNINGLCFASLSLGFAEGKKVIGPEIVREVLAEREPEGEKVTQEPATPPPPPWLGELLNANLGAEFVRAVPRHVGRSIGLFVCGLLLLPLLLVALESSSREGVLEALVGRLTGYDTHVPSPPNALPPALQAPKPPVPIPEANSDFSPARVKNSDLEIASSQPAQPTPVHQSTKVKSKPSPGRAKVPITRVIFAHRGDTLYGLARRYYGSSNGAVVDRIHAHNPQIHNAGTFLQENQPVVIPDLAPEYPWKIAASIRNRY